MLRLFWILLLIQHSLLALDIDDRVTFDELLSDSEIYIDYNRSEDIVSIQNRKFQPNSKKYLGYGYSPNLDIWIRFSLINKRDYPIKKIIEYNNPLTSYVEFFENGLSIKRDGLLDISKDRVSINPILEITLKPYESREFYIKASSKITTLIVELNLWTPEDFYQKEMAHQVILALFFGAMIIIILYNLIVFLATRELSYLYYVLFFASVSFHHLMYRGVASLYLFSPETMEVLIGYSSFIVAMPTIFLALFTQNILRLNQYPRVNKTLNYLLILYPISIITIEIIDEYQYRSIFFIVILLFLFFTTCYALLKKNREARFIIVGWVLFVSSGVLLYLSSSGKYHIFDDYPYLTELSLVLEIIVFSFALASKIKLLTKEKNLSQSRALLIEELNHRVKNSMQIIISFLVLQKDRIEGKNIEDILTNLENRVRATEHLYSLLDIEKDKVVVDINSYFSLIAESIKSSFKREDIEIAIYSDVLMNSDYVVYTGLIINEALTNAFKYAFGDSTNSKIEIFLYKKRGNYHLNINDNGSGFRDKPKDISPKNSLGLDIIQTLATIQLEGSLDIKKDNGVEIDIVWSIK